MENLDTYLVNALELIGKGMIVNVTHVVILATLVVTALRVEILLKLMIQFAIDKMKILVVLTMNMHATLVW